MRKYSSISLASRICLGRECSFRAGLLSRCLVVPRILVLCVAYYSIKKYLLQFEKVWRPKTRYLCIPKSANLRSEESKPRRMNRIPSSDRGESISPAARIRTRHDVVEARKAVAIQPGVEEAKWGLALGN